MDPNEPVKEVIGYSSNVSIVFNSQYKQILIATLDILHGNWLTVL